MSFERIHFCTKCRVKIAKPVKVCKPEIASIGAAGKCFNHSVRDLLHLLDEHKSVMLGRIKHLDFHLERVRRGSDLCSSKLHMRKKTYHSFCLEHPQCL